MTVEGLDGLSVSGHSAAMQNAPDTERFLADLHALRRIGAFRTGVHRPTYTPEDMQSR